MDASIFAYHNWEPEYNVRVYASMLDAKQIQVVIGSVTHFMTPSQFDQFRRDIDQIAVRDVTAHATAVAESPTEEVNHVGI